MQFELLMKGGGCENVGTQFALPDAALGADRSLDGVYRCALEGLVGAQGKGCAPGVLGICVGGDRATGHTCAKEQFFRPLDDVNGDAALAELEDRLLTASAELGIGPMGLGGKTTLLGVKAASLARLPASYFVSVSYMCWALRRHGIAVNLDGAIEEWIA